MKQGQQRYATEICNRKIDRNKNNNQSNIQKIKTDIKKQQPRTTIKHENHQQRLTPPTTTENNKQQSIINKQQSTEIEK
jgi:hypothetical protein